MSNGNTDSYLPAVYYNCLQPKSHCGQSAGHSGTENETALSAVLTAELSSTTLYKRVLECVHSRKVELTNRFFNGMKEVIESTQ